MGKNISEKQLPCERCVFTVNLTALWWYATHANQYLSHKVSEEEHIAEEGRPSQQVTDTQAAVMAWHVHNSFHQRPKCHPLLGLQIYPDITDISANSIDDWQD